MGMKDYLLKLQELQRDTFETKVNIEINTRVDANGPWFVGWASVEGFTEIEDEAELDKRRYYFAFYNFHTEKRHQEIYNEIVEFIKTWENEN